MRHLQHALDLAVARGYLDYPEVRELQRTVPDWFLQMGDPVHLAAFEQRHGVTVPAVLREFYGCVPLACFLEACYPEVFLTGYAEECSPAELPPLIRWASGLYLVTGFHNHSGAVAAVALNGEADPPEVQGFEDDPDCDTEAPNVPFSAAVLELVDRYERVLDELVAMYDAAVAAGGDVDWILDSPGVGARLEARD